MATPVPRCADVSAILGPAVTGALLGGGRSFGGTIWVELLWGRGSLRAEAPPCTATVRWQQPLLWTAESFSGAGFVRGIPRSQRRCWAVLQHCEGFDPGQEPCNPVC